MEKLKLALVYCLSATWTKTTKLIRCIIHNGGAYLMAERKRYSAEEKSAIVLEILQDGKKVSDVAEEHGIHPNQIMLWKKQALENMAELFKTERKDITAKKEQREISELKSQIAHKDSVIAELADENMSLKKKSFGLRLTK